MIKFFGKHLKKTLIIVLFFVLLSGITITNILKEKEYKKTAFLLDTIITIKAYGNNSDTAVKYAVDRIREIDDKMSAYKDDSEVSFINKKGYNNDISVSEDTFEVIQRSVYYSKITEGYFDVTVKPLIELWNFGSEIKELPDEAEIERLIHYVGFENIIVNTDKLSIRLGHEKMGIDLGGIAKGYAADETIRILKENGIERAFVDLGGNIVVMGKNEQNTMQKLLNIIRRKQSNNDKKWKIGIQDPREQRGSPMAAIEVTDKAVVSSGAYERNFEVNGQIYHHIIDPFTGYPAQSGLISVTIISESSLEADALSTGVYVLGEEKGMKLIESIPNVETIMINNNNEVLVSKGLQNKVEILNSNYYIK